MTPEEFDQLRKKQEHLKEQVLKFKMLELPGQMPMMHMGTSYLVSDLEGALAEALGELEKILYEKKWGKRHENCIR